MEERQTLIAVPFPFNRGLRWENVFQKISSENFDFQNSNTHLYCENCQSSYNEGENKCTWYF